MAGINVIIEESPSATISVEESGEIIVSIASLYIAVSGGGSNPFNQDLNTTDDVDFNSVTLPGGDVQTQLNAKLESESDPVVGAISGIIKSDGLGNISAATPNTDYQSVLSEGAFSDGDKTKLDTHIADNTLHKYEAITIACSDETTDLAAETGVVEFQMPFAMILTKVIATVTTAPVGSAIEVDINEGGVSILSTVISIDAGEKTSESANTPPVISDASLASGGVITIDIDQIGASTAGTGLKVYLEGTRV